MSKWKAFGVLAVISLILSLWISQDLRASGHEAPPPAVEEPAEKEDTMRLRVRKRLEDGPDREVASVPSTSSAGEQDLKVLWDKLQSRQAELDAKAAELAKKEQAIAEREALVKNQLSRYEQTLTTMRTEVESLRGLKNTKLEEFRKIYSKMEGKKAARILDEMDTDLAGQILSSLKESQSAEILGLMDPEKARRITARFLTGRSFSQVSSQ